MLELNLALVLPRLTQRTETSFPTNFLCFSYSISCNSTPDKYIQTQVKAIGSPLCADVFWTYYRGFFASLTAHKQSTLFPLIYLFLLQTLHFSNNRRCLLRNSPAIVLQMAINWTKLCSSESRSAVSSAACWPLSPVVELCSRSQAVFRPSAKCCSNTSCIFRRSRDGLRKSSLLLQLFKTCDRFSELR